MRFQETPSIHEPRPNSQISVIAFNAGKVLRGKDVVVSAIGEMANSNQGKATIIFVQEFHPEHTQALHAVLSDEWSILVHQNSTDKTLGMLTIYSQQLRHISHESISLPSLPKYQELLRQYFTLRSRERRRPIQREAQLHLFTLGEVQLIVASPQLDAMGGKTHREEQIKKLSEDTKSFQHRHNITEEDPFMIFIAGDFNTAGRSNRRRN